MAGLGVTIDRSFWSGRRVLVTGHTGFKGGWLSLWLADMGAEVFGLALAPETDPSLFDQLALQDHVDHAEIDLRDQAAIDARVNDVAPQVIFHLAAQPLVRRSYANPVGTWATNVLGTVHLLNAVRRAGAPCTMLVATTDKVYSNRDWAYGYRENDRLGGHDPYSASKAATELAIDSYRSAFFDHTPDIRLVSARAGNVIGGGDWALDRIVPDIVRALNTGDTIATRNPAATRPWQHVLEPLSGYLSYAQALDLGGDVPPSLNFGPGSESTRTVRNLLETTLSHWPGKWRNASNPSEPHEARLLALSVDLARDTLGWQPVWDFETSIEATIHWYRSVLSGADALSITREQIEQFKRDQ